jgi:hypothetical protein
MNCAKCYDRITSSNSQFELDGVKCLNSSTLILFSGKLPVLYPEIRFFANPQNFGGQIKQNRKKQI